MAHHHLPNGWRWLNPDFLACSRYPHPVQCSSFSLQLGRTYLKCSASPVPCQGLRGPGRPCRRPCEFGSPMWHRSTALSSHCPISSQITSEHWTTYFSHSQRLFFSYPPGSFWAEGDSVVWSLAPGWWPVSLWPGRNFQRTSGMQAALRGTGWLPNLTSKLGQERPHICFHQRKGMFVETGSSGAYLTLPLSSPCSEPPAPHWGCAITSTVLVREVEMGYCCSLEHLREGKGSPWLRLGHWVGMGTPQLLVQIWAGLMSLNEQVCCRGYIIKPP